MAEILLVQGPPGAVAQTTEALHTTRLTNLPTLALDARSALAYLGAGAGGTPPDIVLLDLDLDGGIRPIDFLRRLRRMPGLAELPVIGIGGTLDEGTLEQCLALGMEAYVAKPVDGFWLMNAIRSLPQFWIRIVEITD
jgi:CheY-like chemotaxis protein